MAKHLRNRTLAVLAANAAADSTTTETLAADLLHGAPAIADELGVDVRRAFYLFDKRPDPRDQGRQELDRAPDPSAPSLPGRGRARR
jgi:hypothetical protein